MAFGTLTFITNVGESSSNSGLMLQRKATNVGARPLGKLRLHHVTVNREAKERTIGFIDRTTHLFGNLAGHRTRAPGKHNTHFVGIEPGRKLLWHRRRYQTPDCLTKQCG